MRASLPRLLVLVVVAGCGSDPSCYITDVVDRFVAEAPLVDCGSMRFDGTRFDAARYAELRTCLLDAVAQRAPFRGAWHEDNFEELAFHEYVGVVRDGVLELSAFHMDVAPDGPDGDMINLPTHRETCGMLADRGDCGREYESLCIACVDSIARESCPD